MPPVLSRASLVAALGLLFAAGLARADFDALSYDWTASPFAVLADGGTRDGAVNLLRPQGGSLGGLVSPVEVSAFTALADGADRYHDAAYALTFRLTDPDTRQSHTLVVHGHFDGTVTSDRVSLVNTFTGGSGSQAFDLLGRDYVATFGFTAAGVSPGTWEGDITASVRQVGDPAPNGRLLALAAQPGAAPEPAALVLAALALPALALAGRRLSRPRHAA